MKRKAVWIMTAVLCLSVCLLSSSIFKITDEDEALYDSYKRWSWIDNHTKVTTEDIIIQTGNYPGSGGSGGSGSSGDPGTITIPGVINSSDLREIAKAVAQSYLIDGEGYYVGADGWSKDYNKERTNPNKADTPYGDVTYNSRTVTPYTANNNTIYYRCCNGLTSAVLKLAGVEHYKDGSNISSSGYISCANQWTKFEQVNVTTCNELQVGDILCWDGHVEIVVYKDSDKVYIAGAGSATAIKKTSENGYKVSYDLTANLRNSVFNSSTFYGVTRP